MQRLMFCLAGLALLAFGGSAAGQSYPAEPVHITITSGPGGAFDIISRALAPAMSDDLGQPVVIDNRPGAGGTVALNYVARAKPDGYTLITAGISQLVLNPFFRTNIPYDVQKDFAPIGLIGDLVTALYVHESVPATTLKEFINYTKSGQRKLFYGTHGLGSSFHLAFEILISRTGAVLTHVPYKGTAPARQDFFAGRVQTMFYPPSAEMLGMIKEGTIRPLAVVSPKRLPQLPDVPTFDEAGVKNLGVSGWCGLLAPAGTPREIVQRINRAMLKASESELAGKGYTGLSMIKDTSSPQEMVRRIDEDVKFWGGVIRKLGLAKDKG